MLFRMFRLYSFAAHQNVRLADMLTLRLYGYDVPRSYLADVMRNKSSVPMPTYNSFAGLNVSSHRALHTIIPTCFLPLIFSCSTPLMVRRF